MPCLVVVPITEDAQMCWKTVPKKTVMIWGIILRELYVYVIMFFFNFCKIQDVVPLLICFIFVVLVWKCSENHKEDKKEYSSLPETALYIRGEGLDYLLIVRDIKFVIILY